LAFQLQDEELESTSQFLLDRRMAMSFAVAVQANGQILDNNVLEEGNAAKDRDIARHWTENGCPVAEDPQSSSESTALDDEILNKLKVLYVSGLEGYRNVIGLGIANTEIEQAESSAWAGQRTAHSPSLMRRCVACREERNFSTWHA
jgi:hypothetical protein